MEKIMGFALAFGFICLVMVALYIRRLQDAVRDHEQTIANTDYLLRVSRYHMCEYIIGYVSRLDVLRQNNLTVIHNENGGYVIGFSIVSRDSTDTDDHPLLIVESNIFQDFDSEITLMYPLQLNRRNGVFKSQNIADAITAIDAHLHSVFK